MNWSEISGFGGWANALDECISALLNAFQAKDTSLKEAAIANLRDYIKHSPNDIAGPLDDLALATVLSAVAKDWGEGIVDLQSRSAELSKLTKQLNSIVAANHLSAESIRLTRIRSVIDHSTEAIRSFSDLKDDLASKGEGVDSLASKVDAAIKAVQTLRNEVEKLGSRGQ